MAPNVPAAGTAGRHQPADQNGFDTFAAWEPGLYQVEAMGAGFSVRKTSARMGVRRTVAFRWRHRFPTAAR